MRFGKFIGRAMMYLVLAANLGSGKIPTTDPSSSQLRNISTTRNGGRLIVTLNTRGDYRFEQFELDNPKRLIIDLIRLRNGLRSRTIAVDSENLKTITVTQFRVRRPPITRVALTLPQQGIPYSVARDGDNLQIVIDSTSDQHAALETAPTSPAAAEPEHKTSPTTSASTASGPDVPRPDTLAAQAAPPPYFKIHPRRANPRSMRVRPHLERPFEATRPSPSIDSGRSGIQAAPPEPEARQPASTQNREPSPASSLPSHQVDETPKSDDAKPVARPTETPLVPPVSKLPQIAQPSQDPDSGSRTQKMARERDPLAEAPSFEKTPDIPSGQASSRPIAEPQHELPDPNPARMERRAVKSENLPPPAPHTPTMANRSHTESRGPISGRQAPPAADSAPERPASQETPSAPEITASANSGPTSEPAAPHQPARRASTSAQEIPTIAPIEVTPPAEATTEPTLTAVQGKRAVMAPEKALSVTLASKNRPPRISSNRPPIQTRVPVSRLPAPPPRAVAVPAPTKSQSPRVQSPPQRLSSAASSKLAAANAPRLAPQPAPPLSTPIPSSMSQAGLSTGPGQGIPIPTSSSQYTGEPIDLKVKDLDLVDFFRMMAEISGLNISVDPDVSGTITMTMGGVPWDQIFDLALATHRLERRIDGNVVRVAKKETLQEEENAKKALKQAVEDAMDTEIVSIKLNYADAKLMSEIITDQLSPRGVVFFDERTNMLIINDVPRKTAELSQLIRGLDISEPQVLIESRIVQATRNFAREIGVNLGLVIGNGERVTAGAPPISGGGVPGFLNPNVNLPAARNNGQIGIKVGNFFDTFLLDAAITAGEQKGDAKLLSKPKITAQNNQEAVIRQGTRFPIQVVQNNTISVQFQDAALTLRVTPQITDENTILLDLRVENNVADFTNQVNGIPSISTSESQTKVLIPDGGTTVIGGILIDEDRNTKDQVPGLASIPIFGHLFKRESKVKRTEEVLFFVTCRIER